MIGRRRRAAPTVRAVRAPVRPEVDATGRRIDALARELAGPVSRRRALGLFGAATALAVAPGLLRPGRAAAAGPQCGNIRCTDGAVCCPAPDGLPGSCCTVSGAMRCGDSGFCEPTGRCEDGRERCGSAGCCREGETCVDGYCRAPCPPRQTRCGSVCCPDGERCVKPGVCRPCGKGKTDCGKACCDRRTEFCCDPDRGVCCKKGVTCCFDAQERGTCCEKGHGCAKPIVPGGAIDATQPRACCPQERLVPFQGNEGCCPAGTVSMGGALVVVPGGGDGGLCCREQFKCGRTCCANNAFFQQVCRDGRCVDLLKDDRPTLPGR